MFYRTWTVFGPEWQATVAALRLVDDRLPTWLREQMEEAAEQAANKARARVMAVGVRGGPAGHTGMRARVAAGVRVRQATQVGDFSSLRITTSMPENDEAIIPRGLDSPKGWRHPLFGNRAHWFRSIPTSTGWLTETVAEHREEIANAMTEGALERAAAVVDRVS